MSEPNFIIERLREPFNETTRKTRRNLLVSSLIGVAISKIGLVPEKISAFGIDFSKSNQSALLTLLIFIVSYF
tara:strand:+ start:304 stop:522 length:219 start_codon:yes stop_codon:yes gene_type:complete